MTTVPRPVGPPVLTEHELRLIRRGLKALHYELTRKIHTSGYTPAAGSKDIDKENLVAVDALLVKVSDWKQRTQAALRDAGQAPPARRQQPGGANGPPAAQS